MSHPVETGRKNPSFQNDNVLGPRFPQDNVGSVRAEAFVFSTAVSLLPNVQCLDGLMDRRMDGWTGSPNKVVASLIVFPLLSIPTSKQ